MANFLLHHLVQSQAVKRPLATALVHQNDTINYQQLADQCQHLSAILLHLGIQASDHISIYLPKSNTTIATFFAISLCRAVFIPINPVLKTRQVQHILQDSQSQLLITNSARLAILQQDIEKLPSLQILLIDKPTHKLHFNNRNIQLFYLDDIFIPKVSTYTPLGIDTDTVAILYTSGSTGQAKGVMLSHRNLLAGAQSVCHYLKNTSEDRILVVLPLSFDYGLSQITSAFFIGASVVLMDYLFAKDIITLIEKQRITALAAVPSLWIKLASLKWPKQCSLRYFCNSGGHLPSQVLEQLIASLPDARPYLMYGLTEAFRSTYVPPHAIAKHKNAIGIAIPNAEILVLREDGSECDIGEQGELVHRGALVAQGYWNAPEQTACSFRPYHLAHSPNEIALWSGDIVQRDKDNYLYFIARKDNLIKTSGYRVSPEEIEYLILQSGFVTEVLVLGVPHSELGQAIIAVFSTKTIADIAAKDIENTLKDSNNDTVVQLTHYCQQHLPNYMQPTDLFHTENLPYNQNNKVDRQNVLKRYQNLYQKSNHAK
jgi:acyl-CoA ligase (AMP-forming) (exosortase A-associated)